VRDPVGELVAGECLVGYYQYMTCARRSTVRMRLVLGVVQRRACVGISGAKIRDCRDDERKHEHRDADERCCDDPKEYRDPDDGRTGKYEPDSFCF
jgi:hypothetical protein